MCMVLSIPYLEIGNVFTMPLIEYTCNNKNE